MQQRQSLLLARVLRGLSHSGNLPPLDLAPYRQRLGELLARLDRQASGPRLEEQARMLGAALEELGEDLTSVGAPAAILESLRELGRALASLPADPAAASSSWQQILSALEELGLVPTAVTRGVFVFHDRLNRWMPTRSIWNQHTYHITNIDDDGGVPALEPKSWLSHNSYRQNRQGLPGAVLPAADLTGGPDDEATVPSTCTGSWPLRAKICNRGAARALAGVQGTFYDGDPRQAGQPLCKASTRMALAPGSCEKVSCSFPSPSRETIDLWLSVDDVGAVAECREGNNLLHLPGTSCLGID